VRVSASITAGALSLLEGEADLWAGRSRVTGSLGIWVVAVSAGITSLALAGLELVADASWASLAVTTVRSLRAGLGRSTGLVGEAATVSTVALASLESVA
jgi:hypothetical protein